MNWLGVEAWKNYGPNGFLSDVTKSDYNFCPADISAGNPRFRSAGGNLFSKNGPKVRVFGVIEVIMASLFYSNRLEILKGGGHVSPRRVTKFRPHCPSGSDTFLTRKLRKREKVIFCYVVYLRNRKRYRKTVSGAVLENILWCWLYSLLFYNAGCTY